VPGNSDMKRGLRVEVGGLRRKGRAIFCLKPQA
jgi:hypothetical protein